MARERQDGPALGGGLDLGLRVRPALAQLRGRGIRLHLLAALAQRAGLLVQGVPRRRQVGELLVEGLHLTLHVGDVGHRVQVRLEGRERLVRPGERGQGRGQGRRLPSSASALVLRSTSARSPSGSPTPSSTRNASRLPVAAARASSASVSTSARSACVRTSASLARSPSTALARRCARRTAAPSGSASTRDAGGQEVGEVGHPGFERLALRALCVVAGLQRAHGHDRRLGSRHGIDDPGGGLAVVRGVQVVSAEPLLPGGARSGGLRLALADGRHQLVPAGLDRRQRGPQSRRLLLQARQPVGPRTVGLDGLAEGLQVGRARCGRQAHALRDGRDLGGQSLDLLRGCDGPVTSGLLALQDAPLVVQRGEQAVDIRGRGLTAEVQGRPEVGDARVGRRRAAPRAGRGRARRPRRRWAGAGRPVPRRGREHPPR